MKEKKDLEVTSRVQNQKIRIGKEKSRNNGDNKMLCIQC